MGRAPCCDKANVKKGPWSPEEDAQLKEYIDKYGTGGNWISLPQKAGLRRCGKSCRLRWLNYLRPNIRHGEFSDEEDRIICSLYVTIGSRWSIIAAQLPGRTDNDIKNYWNTKLKKKLMGIVNNNNLQRSQLSHHKIKPNNNTTTPYNPPMLLHSSPPSQSPLLPSPALSSSPPYKSGANYYNALSTTTTLSFTGFDQSTLLQTPQQGYQLNPNNYLVFGGASEPSCSSSDGSNCNNTTTTTKYDHQVGFYNGSNSVEEEDQKMVFSSGFWEETTPPLMDYGLEEIKQLISTTSAVNGDFSNCSGFNYFDENKTGGERAMLYY